MNRFLTPLLALGAAAALALSAPAAAPPALEAPGDDMQDVVLLTEGQPVLARIHVRVDGKAYAQRWERYISQLFAFLDRNGDGVLDRAEAERVPVPVRVQTHFQGNPFFYGGQVTIPFNQLDADGDGKVTRDELARYYRANNAGPLMLGPSYVAPFGGVGADAVTDALFKALDTNGDGKLSKAELQAAVEVLAKFDANDDELISAQELAGNTAFGLGRIGGGRVVPAGMMGRPGLGAGGSLLLLVPRPNPSRRATSRLMTAREVVLRYDTNRNGKIDRDELTLPKDVFDRIDTNRDGKLDVLEIARWLGGAPDVTLTVRLGKTIAAESGVEVARGTKLALNHADAYSASLKLGTSRIHVARYSAPMNVANYRPFFLNQFRQLDKDRKGFVAREQVNQPQFQYLRGVFELADRDNDGRLTTQELDGYLDMVTAAAGCQVSLSLAETGRGLFQLLDANGDGQLSLRELRSAWSRVADLDADGDGCISRAEIPRQFQLTVSQGPNYGGFVRPPAPVVRRVGPGGAPAAPTRGPVWFRKMDRNGDGEVSRREWLGTSEDFDRIDTDGDGVISLEEAEKADALWRKKAKAGR
jgi:Ca2+-binding EF-hand superfamily protein